MDESETEDSLSAQASLTPIRRTSPGGMRQYNARLIMSLIRERGPLSRGEIARLTGMSPQASAVIVSALEKEGMLVKGEPQRGQVGQPSIPMQLDPEGAFSFGVKIGRRSAELVLMDFTGTVRASAVQSYSFPDPARAVCFVRDEVNRMLDAMTRRQIGRIAGLGIGAPQEIWNWGDEMGVPAGKCEAWRSMDLARALSDLGDWPVMEFNDATAACAAEITFGENRGASDFLYFFVATVIGGGVVLNGALYPGGRGYAGSVGSIPVTDRRGMVGDLASTGSIFLLERALSRSESPQPGLTTPDAWPALPAALLQDWIEDTGFVLAQAIAASVSLIDFERVVIDGSLPVDIRERLIGATRRHYAARGQKGVAPFTIAPGSLGSHARAIGAAALPLVASFGRDREILFG